MAGERYFQATFAGFTGVVNVSAEFVGECIKSQVAGQKYVNLRGVQGEAVQGEIRCEVDPSAKLYTKDATAVMTLVDAAGAANKTFTLRNVYYKGMSTDSPSEDTKPMAFGVKFEAKIPA